MRRRAKGFSSLEMLFAAAALLPIAVLFAYQIHRSLHSLFEAYAEASEASSSLAFYNLVDRSSSNADGYRFNIPPRVHKHSEILFTDGSPNQILKTSAALVPSPQSDALTSVRLMISKSYRVMNVEESRNSYLFHLCPRYGETIEKDEFAGFLGVGVDGFVELQGRLGSVDAHTQCRKAALYASQSMIVPWPNIDPAFVRLLIPIDDEYTYYMSVRGELRLLRHKGELNIENQPLLRGITKVSFDVDILSPSALYSVKGDIRFKSGHLYPFSFLNSLSRLPHFNFLLDS